ncbi:geranylgeranylglycerol-phosphate geranylgeranyltransferase [uncultured Polaribacter sp.]|uniref:geranylgeranylglycerol-phosphate geranylgeranyltransferase n=1 Tax=uncultured Polaribacter sp. TaxID=174711 RepID=UPI0026149C1D|nr:geranylgeranylglycerol-phosphate geranylgeranyltransferase [uncultured Polaribacter sp.]
MASLQIKQVLLKFFSLFSVVRGYNILVLIFAQYLAAIFVFSPTKSVKDVVFDLHLLFLILACVCVIAGGYIINNFYDDKLDRINRPLKVGLDGYIKQSTKLRLYFLLNFIGFYFGTLISWRAALFFALFIFGIWFYSHKLKKYPFLGIFSASTLTITPFFAVFIYFDNFSKIIFVHAGFLFLVILVRQLIKDLENLKGAIANNYKTFPAVYGEKKTKILAILLLLITVFPVYILLTYANLSYMKYYFYVMALALVFISFMLWKSHTKNEFRRLHNLLKILLFIGVICLIFIDTSLLLDKVILRLK